MIVLSQTQLSINIDYSIKENIIITGTPVILLNFLKANFQT